ncbi:signal recognition particle subunit SRP19 [Enteropsectra breve]|nr:signal recognition particle subunit SRP19 [Enteropsectra breve]
MDSEYFMLYPVYIDSSKTCNGGRKYPLDKSVPNPKLSEITAALDRCQMCYKVDAQRKHPKNQKVSGRVAIKKDVTRKDIVLQICDEIINSRSIKQAQSNKSKVANTLNLVPIRKKKSKKK